MPFHRGDTLLAFTDGLIEHREEDVDRGQERVRDGMRALADGDLAAALHGLATTLADPSRDDDVAALAALAARRTA